jgi:hypothetical protein
LKKTLKHWARLLALLSPFAVIAAIACLCIIRMGPTSVAVDVPYDRVLQAVNQTIPSYDPSSSQAGDSFIITDRRQENNGAKTIFVISHEQWLGSADKFADASSITVIRKNDRRTRIAVLLEYGFKVPGMAGRSRHRDEERRIVNEIISNIRNMP